MNGLLRLNIIVGHTKEEYDNTYGDLYEEGEVWDLSLEDVDTYAIELNDEYEYWWLLDEDDEPRIYETRKPYEKGE